MGLSKGWASMPMLRNHHSSGKAFWTQHPLVPHLSGLRLEWQLGQNLVERWSQHTEFSDQSCHKVRRSDVKGGIPGLGSRGSDGLAMNVGDL